MSSASFKRIGLIGRPQVAGIGETLTAIYQYLREQGASVYVEKSCQSLLKDQNLAVIEPQALQQQVDVLIVVGGDGSLLHAAHIAIQQDLPILGINRGKLGFLTDINPDEYGKIQAVINGNYHIESRFMLEANLYDGHQKINTGLALNEVIVSAERVVHMLAFETYVDDQFVCQQRADGAIIATPTGSTAYALSAGGPILHPKLDAIALMPMCSHTLSSRPLVINGDQQICIKIADDQQHAQISCDGIPQMRMSPQHKIIVKKSGRLLHLVHPYSYDYYQALREKLGWESRHH